MRISDWSSDVCSSDLSARRKAAVRQPRPASHGDRRPSSGACRRRGAAARLVAAQARWPRAKGRNPLSDRRFLPHQFHLPRKLHHGALLGRDHPQAADAGGRRMTPWFQNLLGEGFGWFVATTILILLIVLPLLLAVAFSVYADRKIWAAMQMRRGPNVVGPWGLLQSFADEIGRAHV